MKEFLDGKSGRLLKGFLHYVAWCLSLFGVLVFAVGLYIPGAIILIIGGVTVYATWTRRKHSTSTTSINN